MHARHPALYAAARPPLFPCGPCGHDIGAYSQNVPVQRPLARRRVLLSHQFIAYYGLICASRPPRRFMDYGDESTPDGLLWAGSERVPIFLCLSVPFVPSSVPRWMEWLALVVLAIPTRLHRLCTGSASISPPSSVLRWTASRGCKVRFMLRPEEIASPSPTRTFTFELSPPESPLRGVEYSYAANQQFPRPDFHR
jgi:hypothetical protein